MEPPSSPTPSEPAAATAPVRSGLRVGAALALVLAVGAGAAFLALRGDEPVEAARVPPVVEHLDDGLRYTFHVPTGAESLFDVERDPKSLRNLLDERPADALRLRRALERELRVNSLADLRSAHKDTIERLRKLGYL